MAENSEISWTTHTHNPWIGCTKVSPGCAHCYAEADFDKRKSFAKWGASGTRVVTSDANWKKPLKWDRDAAAAGRRERVFCASLADVFEGPETMPAEAGPVILAARVRLFGLIARTPHLDWLLLTKRPQNVMELVTQAWHDADPPHGVEGHDDAWSLLNEWVGGKPPANVWLGTSVEDQQRANERVPALLDVPAAVRFLSMEPLLEPVDLSKWLGNPVVAGHPGYRNDPERPAVARPMLNWVIVGGESGPHARTFDLAWARSLRDQCRAAGVSFFMKQLGVQPVAWKASHEYPTDGSTFPLRLADRKGGDPEEWPTDLRVQEFPTATGGRR